MTGLRLSRATQIGLGLLVLVMAALSMVASTSYVPDPGIDGGDVGAVVTGVIPGSPAWRDEIRSGDRIQELQQSDSAGGWGIVVVGSDGVVRRSGTTDHIGILRSQIPWSALALAISAFAAFAAYRGHRAAAAILPIALFLAAEPLLVAGALVMEVPAGAIVFVGGSIAAIAFTRARRAYLFPVLAGLALAGFWVIAILASPDTFDAIDAARPVGAIAFSICGIVVALDRRRVSEFMTGPLLPRIHSGGGSRSQRLKHMSRPERGETPRSALSRMNADVWPARSTTPHSRSSQASSVDSRQHPAPSTKPTRFVPSPDTCGMSLRSSTRRSCRTLVSQQRSKTYAISCVRELQRGRSRWLSTT